VGEKLILVMSDRDLEFKRQCKRVQVLNDRDLELISCKGVQGLKGLRSGVKK
jgi:hypothetical protein